MDKSKWEYKKLGEVCANKRDIIRAHKFFSSSDEIIYIDISSINNCTHIIDGFTRYIFSEAPSRAQQVVVKNDVLYSLVRPKLKNIAIINLPDINLVASSGFCILRGERIVSKFLYYILLSNRFTEYILRHIAGANYPATKIEDVMNYGSYIPSIPEQRIIVSELDQLNELISLKQQQLKEYDTLAQSLFYEMFGDIKGIEKQFPQSTFGECFKLSSGEGLTAKNFKKGDYPVYGGNGIAGYHNKFNLEGQHIIIGRVGALCGNVHLVEGEIFVTDNAFILTDNKGFDLLYLRQLLALLKLRRYAREAMQPVISNKTLKNITIPLPPLALQQSFAERVRAIEQQKTLVKQSIAEVQTLLDSRMQEYFG